MMFNQKKAAKKKKCIEVAEIKRKMNVLINDRLLMKKILEIML